MKTILVSLMCAILIMLLLAIASADAQTPLQAFRSYQTNWQAGPVIEHQDGTNLVKTQAFQVLELTTVLHSQGSRVIHDAPPLLSVPTTNLPAARAAVPMPTRPMRQGGVKPSPVDKELTGRERALQRQALSSRTNAPVKK